MKGLVGGPLSVGGLGPRPPAPPPLNPARLGNCHDRTVLVQLVLPSRTWSRFFETPCRMWIVVIVIVISSSAAAAAAAAATTIGPLLRYTATATATCRTDAHISCQWRSKTLHWFTASMIKEQQHLQQHLQHQHQQQQRRQPLGKPARNEYTANKIKWWKISHHITQICTEFLQLLQQPVTRHCTTLYIQDAT